MLCKVDGGVLYISYSIFIIVCINLVLFVFLILSSFILPRGMGCIVHFIFYIYYCMY